MHPNFCHEHATKLFKAQIFQNPEQRDSIAHNGGNASERRSREISKLLGMRTICRVEKIHLAEWLITSLYMSAQELNQISNEQKS